jgi:hypothetical protein
MEPKVTKVLVEKLPKKSIISDFNVQFEFDSFEEYKRGEEISTKTEIPEIDAVW